MPIVATPLVLSRDSTPNVWQSVDGFHWNYVFPRQYVSRDSLADILQGIFNHHPGYWTLPSGSVKYRSFDYSICHFDPRSFRQFELLCGSNSLAGGGMRCGRSGVGGTSIGDRLNARRVRVTDEHKESQELDSESYPFAVWAVLVLGGLIGFVGWCLIRKGRGSACVLGLVLFVGGLLIFWHGLKLKELSMNVRSIRRSLLPFPRVSRRLFPLALTSVGRKRS